MTPVPLSIGLPVYNGENFLAETLDSLLAQTWGDFEIVITDNQSTDSTREICQDYASRDSRIQYHLNEENLGAAVNYQRCFHLSHSPYFRWQAHDDPAAPTLLERCMTALAQEPNAVLAYSKTESIDEAGKSIKVWRSRPDLADPDPLVRVHDLLTKQETFPIWGIVPRHILAATPLLGSFTEHDRPLLYELALHGPFVEVDEPLFFDREHAGRSVRAFDHTNPYLAVAWYDNRLEGRLIFPAWRLLREYTQALHRSPISPSDYPRHVGELLRWSRRNQSRLVNDLHVAAERSVLLGKPATAFRQRHENRSWKAFLDGVILDLANVPDGSEVIFIDEHLLDRNELSRIVPLEFPEANGVWAGLPQPSSDATEELDRRRSQGVRYLAIMSPSAWWLDHYDAFASHLSTVGQVIIETDRIALYELAPIQSTHKAR